MAEAANRARCKRTPAFAGAGSYTLRIGAGGERRDGWCADPWGGLVPGLAPPAFALLRLNPCSRYGRRLSDAAQASPPASFSSATGLRIVTSLVFGMSIIRSTRSRLNVRLTVSIVRPR